MICPYPVPEPIKGNGLEIKSVLGCNVIVHAVRTLVGQEQRSKVSVKLLTTGKR